MDKKKVCIVVYNYAEIGGVNAVACEKAKALTKEYDVAILSIIDKGDKCYYTLPSNIKYDHLLKKDAALRKQIFNVILPAYRYFKKNNFDLVICMGHYPGFLLSFLKTVSKSKLLFSDHGALCNQWNDYKARIMRLITAKCYDKIVVLTEQNKNDYIEKFHTDPLKIECIYNWIDIEKCSRSAGYNQMSTAIVSVGRLGEEKGFDLLIKIFSRVLEKHPDWTLDIYGDGEMKSKIQAYIEELNLEEKVTLKGMRNDVLDQYKNYAFYVMTSYREGLPLVLLEAKANKLPIISFDIMTGPKEIINHDVDGILIPAYDLHKFADAICDLIENKEKRAKMSVNSKMNLEKFSKEKIMIQWISLIEEICKN